MKTTSSGGKKKVKKKLVQGNPTPHIKKFKQTESLKVPLTDKDLLALGESLSKTLREIIAVEGEAATTAKQFKAKVAALSATANSMTEVLTNKWEYRRVDTLETQNLKKGTSITIRLDTKETLRERILTHDERQGVLFEDEPKAAKGKKDKDEIPF